MNRAQFMLSLAFMGMMSLIGSFVAVYALQGGPVQAQDAQPGLVKGTEFQLVDKDGKVRADLSLDEDGEVLFTLIDTGGKGRVQLNSGGKRAYMALLDDSGMVRYIVGQDDDIVMQTFADEKGGTRMVQSYRKNGETLLAFGESKDRNFVTLMGGGGVATTLAMNDASGKHTVSLIAQEKQSSLQLEAGDGSLLTAVLDDGRPVLALNKAEKLRMRAMLKEDGEPEFLFLNEQRESVWKAGK